MFGLRGLLLAAILGPATFGVWSLFRLSIRYAAFAALGLGRGLEFELTQTKDSSCQNEKALFARTTLGFTFVVFVPLSLASLIGSYTVANTELALGMRAFGAAIVAERVAFYLLIYLRDQRGLKVFSSLEAANSGVQLAFAVLLALGWGLAGAFLGFVLAHLFSAILRLWLSPLRPALAVQQLRKMLRVGFPLALTLIIFTALTTTDRLVVASLGGATLLGYYAFAASIAALAISFAHVVRTVIFPDVYSNAQLAGAGPAVSDHLWQTVRPFAWFYPPILGAFALAIEPAIALSLPKYMEAAAPAGLFIFTGVTAGLISLGSLGLVASARQRIMPPFAALALVLNLVLSVWAMRSPAGLVGVAGAALVSQTAYAIAILAFAATAARLTRPARFVFMAVLPLIYCAFVVFTLGQLIPGTDTESIIRSYGIYTLLLLPLAFVIWTGTHTFSTTSAWIRGWKTTKSPKDAD